MKRLFENRFLSYWAPIILYCTIIFIQSSFVSLGNNLHIPQVDKFLHFIIFAILAVLFYRAYNTLSINNNIKLVVFLSIISASLYGLSDEIHQYFVPFRSAEVADFIADSIGACFGVCFYLPVVLKKRMKKLQTH